MTVRVDYTSVRRINFPHGPVIGEATDDGECPWCEKEVSQYEPIVLTGRMIGWNENETERVVDLSSAEWICQSCDLPENDNDG